MKVWIVQRYPYVPGCVNVKLKDDPGANGPELNAPPVAVQVCVTVSLFVTVTVDPTGMDTPDGLKAKLEMLIATCMGGTVVVGGGGGGCVVVGGGGAGFAGGGWVAAPGVDPLEGVPAEGGAVVDETLDGAALVVVTPFFGAPPTLRVVGVEGAVPAGFVVVGPSLPGSERPDCDVVVDCFRALKAAGAVPQAAARVTSANPTRTKETRVR